MLPVRSSPDGYARFKDSGDDSQQPFVAYEVPNVSVKVSMTKHKFRNLLAVSVLNFQEILCGEHWAVTIHLQHIELLFQLHNQGGISVFRPAVGRRPPARLVCATSNAPFSQPRWSCSLLSLASTSGSFGRLKISLSVTKEKKNRQILLPSFAAEIWNSLCRVK